MDELSSPVGKLHYIPIFSIRKINVISVYLCEQKTLLLVCKIRHLNCKITKTDRKKRMDVIPQTFKYFKHSPFLKI